MQSREPTQREPSCTVLHNEGPGGPLTAEHLSPQPDILGQDPGVDMKLTHVSYAQSLQVTLSAFSGPAF